MAKKKATSNKAASQDTTSVNTAMPVDNASSDADLKQAKSSPKSSTKPSFRAQAERVQSTKGAKAQARKKTGKPRKNIFKSLFNGIKSIISELKKVTWPKQKAVWTNTTIVLVVVVVFLIVIFAFDYVLSGLLSLLMGSGWVNIFG